MPGASRCAWCRAKDRERKPWVRHMRHETGEHALVIETAHGEHARCALSGASAGELAAIGERLEVDRIDSRRGYVRGNMQVIAARLNRAKQTHGDDLPRHVVDDLVRIAHGEVVQW